MANTTKGLQVKTGDNFGTIGWWVNKDLKHPINPCFIEDPKDKVPAGANKRMIFVYFGENEPTTDEMRTLIESTDFIYPDANY